MPKVIVVGGGYAGLAAATALAQEGIAVDLLESRGFLGGRAYSIAPSESFPATVDNGPHLFMGCYAETLRMLERIGVREAFHWIDPLAVSWLVPGGKKVSLKCAPLPAPLHLAWGLLASDAFPWGEKILMARALSAFSKRPFRVPPAVETVAQFLDFTRQGPLSRERFWVPLCDSVMNVPPGTAPLRGMGEVLHRIFFGKRRDSAMGVARLPLSEVVSAAGREYLEAKGGRVLFHEGVQEFKTEGRSFELKTRSGAVHHGDALVFAVPPSSLSALWPQGTWEAAGHFPQMGKSPIVSVHLILSGPAKAGHLFGLSGARFEWVFNRNENWSWQGEGQYLSFTASAAEDLARLKDPELVSLAFQELLDRDPTVKDARILHSKVTREMAATFVWNRETDAWRPPCETPRPNVFLAGDWTDTGLPATLEGACFSGHRAAEKTRAYLDQI